MVRIGGGVYPDEIQEPNYFAEGQYRMDAGGSPTMLNCLMYKLSYYRFGDVSTGYGKPAGYDRVRNVEIGVRSGRGGRSWRSRPWVVGCARASSSL